MARRRLINTPTATSQREARKGAMKAPSSFGAGGTFVGKYAWWYLTDQERVDYATWKSTDPTFTYIEGAMLMPKNWMLLEHGSVPGVAREDVGIVGLGFLAAAKRHMENGAMDRIVTEWLAYVAKQRTRQNKMKTGNIGTSGKVVGT